MMKIVGILLLIIWLYILYVLTRSKLPAWRFFWGSGGLFVLMMIYIRPVLTMPVARVVAALAGQFCELSGMFSAYFKYGTSGKFYNRSTGKHF